MVSLKENFRGEDESFFSIKKWFLQLFLLLKVAECVASLYVDIQGCKTDTSLYRCGGHKVYAKLITDEDECVGPM